MTTSDKVIPFQEKFELEKALFNQTAKDKGKDERGKGFSFACRKRKIGR